MIPAPYTPASEYPCLRIGSRAKMANVTNLMICQSVVLAVRWRDVAGTCAVRLIRPQPVWASAAARRARTAPVARMRRAPPDERSEITPWLGGFHKDFRLVKQHNHQRKCNIR